MNGLKGIVLVLASMLVLAFAATTVNAAVTACLNASEFNMTDGSGAWPKYNDTTPKNVTVGNVCYNSTLFDVAPSSLASCNSSWANFTNNTCGYGVYYVGFALSVDNAIPACNNSNWTVKTALTSVSAGSIINNTVIGPIQSCSTGECYVTSSASFIAASNFTNKPCANAYTMYGNTGYCNGAGELGVNDTSTHVAAGRVCFSSIANNNTANATKYCDIWYQCVAGNSSVAWYHTGYAATGTSCVQTSWQQIGIYNLSSGLYYSTTTNASSCASRGYAPVYSKSDLQPIVTDAMGYAGASFVQWTDLVVLLLVLSLGAGLVLKAVGAFRH